MQKIHLAKSKMSYYKKCYSIQETEYKIRDYFNNTTNKKKISQDKINRQYEALLNEKVLNNSRLQAYNEAITKLNQLYDEYEIKYGKVIQTFSGNRKNKGSFIKCIIEKWNKSLNTILQQGLNQLKINSDVFNAFDPFIDKKIFEEEFRDSLHCSFEKEKFISFEEFYEHNQHLFEEEEKNKSNYWRFLQLNNAFFHFVDKDKDKNNEKQNLTSYKIKDKIKETITLFVNNIAKEEYIESDILIDLFELNDKHKSFPYKFIKCYDKTITNSFSNIKNMTNLHHLSNIFNSILMNITLINEEEIDLTYSIIIVSEKTYCDSTYLNGLISKNAFFSIKEYWIILIEHILLKIIKRKINSLLEKYKYKEQLFDDLSFVDKTEIKNNICLLGLEKKLEQYNQLNVKQQKIINESLDLDIHNLIKTIICHFGNYSLEYSEAIELIEIICKKYHIGTNKHNYYISYLNISYLSIRRRKTNMKMERVEMTKEITKDTIINRNTHDNVNKNHIIDINKVIDYDINCIDFKSNNYAKLIIVLPCCLTFIEMKDYLSLLILNKDISNSIKKKIYKHILLIQHQELSLKAHLSMWESILDINCLKTKYNYQSILKSINYDPENKPTKFNLIELDSKRTFFKTNVTQGREIIARILHCVIETRTGTGLIYCQGMNFIAGFIYQIVKEEEKAFYILLGLFSNTDYYTLFLNHLEKLQIFLYICERLLYIYLPELHAYFISNDFLVKLFGSPWLLTLFSNVYPFLLEDEIPNVLMRIWDMFLLKGWKGLFNSLLGLLKYHLYDIIKLNNEELYLFMINNLTKSSIFHNDHFPIFIQNTDSINITNSLLKSLENEYKLENEMKSVRKGKGK